MVEESTEIRFFESGNIAVVTDFYHGIQTIATIDRKNKFSEVQIVADGQVKLHKFETSELKDFIELNFRYKLNHDENPQNLIAFVGEIPIVYDLVK